MLRAEAKRRPERWTPGDARPCPLYQLPLASTPPTSALSPSPRYEHAAVMRAQAPMLDAPTDAGAEGEGTGA
jgi:hypothetical protein